MIKERVLDLANKINRTKRGTKRELKPDHPGYKMIAIMTTDEMAEVALYLDHRDPKTPEQVADLCGKPLDEVKKHLQAMANAGVVFFGEGSEYTGKKDGKDKYWLETWVPGVMEAMVNHRENVKNHPEIAEGFEEYGRFRGPMTAGNIPTGYGVMRVIPIEQAIQGETRRASYEEVSKYIEEAELLCVSDCSCRTSREAMGEGCGHLKEDMCIQLDQAAEYYIRTGRARQIEKEEAYEILRRAEANGLMHQIPNTDGPGKTHAICNCCGCSCYSLRFAEYFRDPDMMRSNYVSKVDKEKCVACGECVEVCPTGAVKLGQKICSKTPIEEKKYDLPYDTDWGEDQWDPDFRTNREVVVESGSSPCKAECPAHIGIQGYIKLAAQGKYLEALELIKHENPFPAVCGRICPRNCEQACTRGDIDDPVAIDDIKKFIAEKDLHTDTRFIPEKLNNYGKKIAVVGAGPAGLSCAFYLAIDGYKVKVYEKQKKLGGMLTLGIPSFRLEKDVVEAEIDILKEMGVEFELGTEVGKDITLDELRTQGYEAFYLAIGAQGGRNLGIEGEDAQGVIAGIEFLRSVNSGEDVKLNGKTIIIGGGNVAIDVARTAIRVGSESVDMYCLESREEMPALAEEIEEALHEDIAINNAWGPKRIITKDGKVVGVEFKKCISVFDKNKRFAPKYDEDATKIVDCDNVLISVGQSIQWGELIDGSKVELNPNKTVKADETTYQTAEPDIFVGGDAYTGPRFAIDAIAQGKEGAISIHRYVHPGQSLVLGRLKRNYRAFDKANVDLGGYDSVKREKPLHNESTNSKDTFKDLRGTFTIEQIQKETERCLGCGASVIDEYMCVGCGACTQRCKFDAISLVRKYDSQGVEISELKPVIIKYAMKRKLRIVAMKPVKAVKKLFTSKK